MEWLAGMRMTAERLNDNTADEETTAGLTVATNWSLNAFQGRKVNGITTVYVSLNRTSATVLTASSAGAIGPQLVCTLPIGWRPPDTIIENFDKSGTADGGVSILATGTCTIQSMSPTATITQNQDITFFSQWISEND
jgi:hypothetical protein